MPSAKEIKSSMRGVRDTMKITKAMYMISTIKMRKAKHQLEATEPYFYGLQKAMNDILFNFPEVKSKFFGEKDEEDEFTYGKEEKPKRIAYIVLSSDRGLAGAYNHNIFNVVERSVEGKTFDEYMLFVVGGLGVATLRGRGYNVAKDFSYTATNPTIARARVIAGHVIEQFENGEFDEVHVIYTRMINSMESTVEAQQLLPLKKTDFIQMDIDRVPKNAGTDFHNNGKKENEFTVYPSAQVVLEEIVRNYVTGYLYGTLVEATACEENSRMTAMKSATDNAKDMLNVLTVQYNRVRQAAITQQITEISSGARALKRKKELS